MLNIALKKLLAATSNRIYNRVYDNKKMNIE